MKSFLAILNAVAFLVEMYRAWTLRVEVAKKVDAHNAEVKANAQKVREDVARLSDDDLARELRASFRD